MELTATKRLIMHIQQLCTDRKYRILTKQAVIHGIHLVEEALKYKVLNKVFVSRHHVSKLTHLELYDVPVYYVTENIMRKINILCSSVSIVGIIDINHDIEIPDTVYNNDCIIMDQLQNVSNIGAIIRTAVGFNIPHLILSKQCGDLYNPKTLRASQGAQFVMKAYHDIMIEQFLNKYQGNILITDINAINNLYEQDLTQPIAWIFGNEGSGISNSIKQHHRVTHVRIPIHAIDSLNVSVAAGVALAESYRQKHI